MSRITETKVLNKESGAIETSDFLDGVLDGRREVTDGQRTVLVTYYRAGKLHGQHQTWYPNGGLHISCGFIEGEYDGPYSSRWDNGQPKEVGTFSRGVRVGTYRWFDKTGMLIKEHVYPS